MSDIKPVGWTARSQSGAFLTLAAERHQVECHPQLYSSDEILPLYDGNTLATAIAEAVAAERERCAKACKDARLNEISAPADWHNDACEACIHAIRSALK